ncbi:hypothetical protein [Methanococcus maripaludis]|uniref:Uncharacterized protein n=1 Tax=Methanococcus maripaludis TaxID=39152 RepID=A0A2L1CA33_METMI|nr:hypothetical protein [Methanococcus maripaludis]AVB76080.1 hypothetical protein MMJJ_06660 [Methanococcus maripaludis]
MKLQTKSLFILFLVLISPFSVFADGTGYVGIDDGGGTGTGTLFTDIWDWLTGGNTVDLPPSNTTDDTPSDIVFNGTQNETEQSSAEAVMGDKEQSIIEASNSTQRILDEIKSDMVSYYCVGYEVGGLVQEVINAPDKIGGFSVFPVRITVKTPSIDSMFPEDVIDYGDDQYTIDVIGHTEINSVTFKVMQGGTVVSKYELTDLNITSENQEHTFDAILKVPDDYASEVAVMTQGGNLDLNDLNALVTADVENFEIYTEVNHNLVVWKENAEWARWDLEEHTPEEEEDKPLRWDDDDDGKDDPWKNTSYISYRHTTSATQSILDGIVDHKGKEGGLGSEYRDQYDDEMFAFKADANGATSNIVMTIKSSMIHELNNPAGYSVTIIGYPEYFDTYSTDMKIQNVSYRLVAINYHADGTSTISTDSKSDGILPDLTKVGVINTILDYNSDEDTVAIYPFLLVSGRIYQTEDNPDRSFPVWAISKPRITIRSNYVFVITDHSKLIDSFLADGDFTASEKEQTEAMFEGDVADYLSKIAELESNRDFADDTDSENAYQKAIDYYQKAIDSLTAISLTNTDSIIEGKNKAWYYESQAKDWVQIAELYYYGLDDQALTLASTTEEANSGSDFGLIGAISGDLIPAVITDNWLGILIVLAGVVVVFGGDIDLKSMKSGAKKVSSKMGKIKFSKK